MTDAECREFITQLIEKVEVYEERQPDGKWIKVKNIAHVFSIVYNIFVVTIWINRCHVGGNHENAR
ncbi:hypothetical protein [Pseudobutyrivibrio sp.]